MRKFFESNRNKNVSDKGMLMGALLGVLCYAFTGNMGVVIIGILVGMLLDRRKKDS